MAGGFAVIKDVPKTLVYALSRVPQHGRGPVIPETTIDPRADRRAAPRPEGHGLLPPYEVLDAILKLYVEEDRSLEEIVPRATTRRPCAG